ncbi:DUF58 domain-containing protein [Cellulomonas carbonis]|uniref:DUF58 domain-containing protein n=1 Tax=Cellulomonas carbonis T26 TaxID=947969 RepID=A0A0A0BUA1_9CELL|nr:DUF58 domain-containing protein [Cellulomonas carbonis]KGM11560.1 hypothetical protein N868_05370 [Cellulomonas carbonis T26]GGC06664.1 hypothetical protein GCM10010972_19880 [Cellulomonas carbonis]
MQPQLGWGDDPPARGADRGDGGAEPPPVGAPWLPGRHLVWTLAASLAVVGLGAVAGRADVVLVGVGPLVAATWALLLRPRGEVWVDVEPATTTAGRIGARVHLAAPPGTEAVRLRVARPSHGHVEALVAVPLTRTLDVTAPSVRTGPQDLVRVDGQGLGTGGHLTGPATRTTVPPVTVLPRAGTMPGLPLPFRLRGLTGQHASRRPGEGGDLRDVHPFQPGDSLRRVDWRVTARRSPRGEQLYTRRTFALAEAHVTLVVDSRDDVGPDPATWSGHVPVRPDDATSLDVARRAAATVARAYLTAGDRVGVEDLGVRQRTLRPGGGRSQLDRVVHQLAVLRPQGDPAPRVRPPQLPSGTLVYLFSTFLDAEPATLAALWRRSGHRVVVVDVLPTLRRGALDGRGRLALRIVEMERRDRVADLAAAGCEVVRWTDDDAAARVQLMARQSHRRPGVGVGR